MITTIIAATVLAVVGVYMLLFGHTTFTRRMAWVPLTMTMMELAMFGALDWAAFPILTAILVLCRLTVVLCCHRVLKLDAAQVRNQKRRRAVLRRMAAHPGNYQLIEAKPAARGVPPVYRCA